MGITNAAAADLINRLSELSRTSDRTSNAIDVNRTATERIANSQNSAADSAINFGKSLYSTTKSLASVPQQIANSTAAVTSISPIITGITQMGASLAQVGGPLAALMGTAAGGPLAGLVAGVLGSVASDITAEAITAVGSTVNFFLQQVQVVIDSFTQLSSVGATFGGSLESLKDLSKDTGLSLETLSKIAVNNAENLALLGGGTQGALKLVTRTSRDLGNTLLALYGGFENLNKETAEYMALRRLQGVSEMATGQALTNQTAEYLYMIKELSALTGKNASQLKNEMAERAKNAAAQYAIDSMSEEERLKFQYQLSLLPEYMKGAYMEEVVNRKIGSDLLSRETLTLEATLPGIRNKIVRAVDTMTQPMETMKENFGKELTGLAADTKRYRETNKDLMNVYAKGYAQNPVLKVINDALTSAGTELGRLSTISKDIKTFSEQTTALKDNAGTFVDEVGKINKEQEKIRMALNRFATEGERFALALDVTSFVLEVTEELIEGVNRILPNFQKNRSETNMQTEPVENTRAGAQLRILEEQRERFLRRELNLDLSREDIQNLRSDQLRLNETQRRKLEFLENKIKEQQERINQINNPSQNNNNSNQRPVSQEDVTTLDTTDLAMASRRIFIETDADTKLNINLSEFMDILTMMFNDQKRTNNYLADAMKDNAYNFKRLLDRIT
jgi:hypothetical protein